MIYIYAYAFRERESEVIFFRLLKSFKRDLSKPLVPFMQMSFFGTLVLRVSSLLCSHGFMVSVGGFNCGLHSGPLGL